MSETKMTNNEPVSLFDFYERLGMLMERTSRDPKLMKVCVKVEKIGAVGGTPTVDIATLFLGFDWDHNKLILHPSTPLMLENPDTLGKLREEMKEIGWSKYENDNLKRENRKLLKRIKELEDMLDLLGGDD